MPLYTTLQTIILLADWALKSSFIFWGIKKAVATVSCRTPGAALNSQSTLCRR
jgi:hypothetical protein